MNPAEFHASRQFIHTPFGRIAYIEQGSGPVTLFLHGLPLCSYEWREVIADLAPVRRCIALDEMGLGYTEVAAGQDVSYAAQARMIAAFLDAAKIDSVDLVGNDTGGGISQIFTTTYPAKVHSLTLTNCEVHDLWPNTLLTGFYAGVSSGVIPQALKTMLSDIMLAHQQLGAIVYENAEVFTPENVQLYLSPIVASDDCIKQFQQLSDWKTGRAQLMEIASKLKASTIPAQIIWGEADPVFDAEPSLNWLKINLGGLKKITRVPRAKLFFPEEHPRLMSVLLNEFWSTLGG
jgi:pimeloyl-ACP methyl ester carboxylesterase